jgi:hypothetical protein
MSDPERPLNPEHRTISERAIHKIMCIINGTAKAPEIENRQPDIGYDDNEVDS